MMTMRASFQNLIPIKPTDESMYFKDTGESKRRPSQNPNLAYDCWQQSNPRLGTISLKARVIDRSPKTGVSGGVGTYRGPGKHLVISELRNCRLKCGKYSGCSLYLFYLKRHDTNRVILPPGPYLPTHLVSTIPYLFLFFNLFY